MISPLAVTDPRILYIIIYSHLRTIFKNDITMAKLNRVAVFSASYYKMTLL